jgi:hypothetical protein
LKISEAHQTQSSSLYSANTIGAPMHPAPIGVAVRTGKKICETKFEYYWRTVSGQHCLLAEGDIGAPIFTSTSSSVRLAYFHTNRLLFGLYKQETEILRTKDEGNIKKLTDNDRHGPKPSSNTCQLPNPPHFSLVTTFNTLICSNVGYTCMYCKTV